MPFTGGIGRVHRVRILILSILSLGLLTCSTSIARIKVPTTVRGRGSRLSVRYRAGYRPLGSGSVGECASRIIRRELRPKELVSTESHKFWSGIPSDRKQAGSRELLLLSDNKASSSLGPVLFLFPFSPAARKSTGAPSWAVSNSSSSRTPP